MKVMTNSELNIKLLYKFLKKKGKLQEFIITTKKYNKIISTDNILEIIKQDRSIGGAFHWAVTPQGHDYWRNLEIEFYRFQREEEHFLKEITVNGDIISSSYGIGGDDRCGVYMLSIAGDKLMLFYVGYGISNNRPFI